MGVTMSLRQPVPMAVLSGTQPECEAAHHRIRRLACGAARLARKVDNDLDNVFCFSISIHLEAGRR